METLTYSSFYDQLEQVFDKVNQEHHPILVTGKEGKSAVIMSLEDFQAYEETAYLMASPANAARLNQGIAEIETGNTVQHELIEE
jgi:antitoxin YefM